MSGPGGIRTHDRQLRRLDWGDFRQWLHGSYRSSTAKLYFNYSRRFWRLLFDKPLSELHTLTANKRRLVLLSLTALSRFLGLYDVWRARLKAEGLRWSADNSLNVFKRIYQRELGVDSWLEEARLHLSWDYWFPIAYTALTGLRASEACLSLSIIAEQGLEHYYNPRKLCLEHFRFQGFLRRTKNAFISIVSDTLLRELENWDKRVTWDKVRSRLKRLGLPCRLQDLRRNHATLLNMNGIPESIVDLLHGRIGKSVFIQFYLRPDFVQLAHRIQKILHPLEVRLLEA